MNKYLEKLAENISAKKSLVCVGLDVQLENIPKQFAYSSEPLFDFNRYIIDQTAPYTAAYKPNLAFYEMYGRLGLTALEKTLKYIPPEIPVILDAKRGDIGNTAKAYAKALFEDLRADATTVSPYLGEDSLLPFLEYRDNFSYILCLTSNSGAADFQKPDLYKKVARRIDGWHQKYQNCGAVVGATNSAEIKELRTIMPAVEFLVPGIGAQGGDLQATLECGIRPDQRGLLINSSRAIIFSAQPGAAANKLRQEINSFLKA